MSTRRPTVDEIRRWTQVDGVREVALVAVAALDHNPRQIGVARYAKSDSGVGAEFAIVIDDEYQRSGVGRALLCALIAEARKDVHLATLSGMTMSENIAMIRLARRLGFQTGREPGNGSVTTLTLTLRTPEPA